MAVEPAAPPWNWNPGQTFVQAFNDAQALQIKREEMENERQIMEILLPYKLQKAKWDIENLKADVSLASAVEEERAANVSYKNAMAEEIRRGRGRGGSASAQWLGPGKGFSSGSTGGDASSYNIDRSGITPVEPDFTMDGEEPPDEDFEPLPDLNKPVEDMPEDPVETSSNNPLRPEDPAAIFADLNAAPGELMPRRSEGWANPLAQIDEDAASVPIGAQKFDTGLADTTPRSEISEDATERLDRMIGPVPEQTAQEPTKDEQILQDVLGRYQTLQQNRKTDFESAAMQGINPPAALEKFYREEEVSIFQEADAVVTPLVAGLSPAAQDSYLKQTTAARPVFPLTAYNRALAMDERAKANPPAENPTELRKQILDLKQFYGEGDEIYSDPDGRAKLNALETRLGRAEAASGTKLPSAWDKVTETFTNEAFLESKRRTREPEFNYLGRRVTREQIDSLAQEEILRRNELLSSPELRNQLRVTRDSYTVYDKNDRVDRDATNAERQRQLATLAPNEPYEAEDGSIKTWSPRAERPKREAAAAQPKPLSLVDEINQAAEADRRDRTVRSLQPKFEQRKAEQDERIAKAERRQKIQNLNGEKARIDKAVRESGLGEDSDVIQRARAEQARIQSELDSLLGEPEVESQGSSGETKKETPTRIQGGLDFGLGEAISKLLTPEESSDPEIRNEFAKNFSWRYDGKPPKIVKLGADPFSKDDRKYLDETWPVPDGKPEGKFTLLKVNGNWYAEEREPTSQKRKIVERLAKRAEDPDEAPKLNNLERAILEKEGYYQPSEEPESRRQGAGAANMLGDAVNAIYGWKYDGKEPGPWWQGSRIYKKREQ